MELFGRISRQSVDVLVIVEVVGDIAHVTAPFILQVSTLPFFMTELQILP